MNEHTQERNCSYAECLQEEARCSPIQKTQELLVKRRSACKNYALCRVHLKEEDAKPNQIKNTKYGISKSG